MARRTQLFQIAPWTGGLNSSVDVGALPQNDLQAADNMIFATSGSRLKREGLSYFDSAIPSVLKRSSSGTTRTIVFSASISTTGPTNQILAVGENVTISAGPASYNGDYVVASIATTTITNDTITYTALTSLSESTTTDTTIAVARNASIFALHDYWRSDTSNVKQQIRVGVTDQAKIAAYDSGGARTVLTNSGTALATGISSCATAVMNEKLILAFDVVGNTPKKYNPDDSANVQDLGSGTAGIPDFSMCQVHQSCLWTNDKTNKDRLHRSATGNPEQWQGDGDSWVVDIDPGDGDSEGITQVHPPFKGDLFVTKGRKTYRVVGNDPSNYQVIPVTNGLGGIGVRSVAAVDLDDIVYCSSKGFHSLAATDTYGEFKGAFLSVKIQPTFKDLNHSRLKFVQSAYIPDLNSIAFAVPGPSSPSNDMLYFYNINIKEWYRWPNVSCEAITTHISSDNQTKLLIGTNDGRVVESQNGVHTDFGTTGIDYRIKTGALYPDGSPHTWKGFKRLTFLFRPLGSFTFTATITVDNNAPQSFSFEQDSGSAALGSTFVLGTSILGASNVLAPYSVPIDGYGRGCTLEITQSGTGEQVEIYGVIIEYEPADLSQEVVGTQ